MDVLDLFSGIGGFSLGLERAGMRTIAFCEIDPYCQAVLRKHWPAVPVYSDIKLMPQALREPYDNIDVICGGFPCQPFSSASRGRKRGTDDRYLWPEMYRVISECRPAWVIGENVTHFDGMALREMVTDLEGIGYEVAPPLEIPACAVGCDHRRSRLWILGHAHRHGKPSCAFNAEVARLSQFEDQAGNYRGANGLSNRLDRLRALGNAIVPQIAEIIGRAIIAHDADPPPYRQDRRHLAQQHD